MEESRGQHPQTIFLNPMTNTKAAKGFIVKTATTYVGFAAAPFAIALAVSSVFTPHVEAKGCGPTSVYYPACVFIEWGR